MAREAGIFAHPTDQEEPEHGQPKNGQAPLQARGGEIPGRGNGQVDEHAERQEDAAPGAIHQPRGQGSQAHGKAGEGETQPQRHGFQLSTRELRKQVNGVLPQHGGVGLHPLPRVEDRPITRLQIADGAQDDQPVIADPAPLPPRDKRHDRQCQCPHHRGDRRNILGLSRGGHTGGRSGLFTHGLQSLAFMFKRGIHMPDPVRN